MYDKLSVCNAFYDVLIRDQYWNNPIVVGSYGELIEEARSIEWRAACVEADDTRRKA